MDKLTAIRIKYDDGTYSDEIPISVLTENVQWDSTHTLVDVLGSIDIDTKGSVQDQLSQLFNTKANIEDLNALSDKIGNISGTVASQLSQLSSTKANASDLTALSNTVDTKANASDLTALSNTVDTKANASDLTALSNTVGNIAPPKTVADQLDQLSDTKVSKIDLSTYVDTKISSDVTSWLNTNVNPVGSAVAVDSSLTISGAAADAHETGNINNAITAIAQPYNRQYQYYWALGSLDINSGTSIDNISNRIRSEGITFQTGDLITLTPYGKENGFKFSVFYYKDNVQGYLGREKFSTSPKTALKDTTYIRILIGKDGIDDMTQFVDLANNIVNVARFNLINYFDVKSLAESAINIGNNNTTEISNNTAEIESLKKGKLITDIAVGSLGVDSGDEKNSVKNRFRTPYIPVSIGTKIELTKYGKENGFQFNVFQYFTTSTYHASQKYIRNRGLSTDNYEVLNLNCAYIRITIAKTNISDVTGMQEDFSKALMIFPSMKNFKPEFLFAENLQKVERFFQTETNYNQSTITASELIEKFDSFVDNNRFSIIKTGSDDFNNVLKAYMYKPRSKGYYNYHTIVQGQFTNFPFPRIMVVGNIHGSERSPAFSSLKLIELLMSNVYINDSIEFIKNNVELILIPISNPSGWNASTYQNGNGYNLNRDFPPYGTASQKETQFIQSVFNEYNNKINFFFDFHNTWWDELNTSENQDNPTEMPIIGYVYTDNPMFQQIGCNIYSSLKSDINLHASQYTDWFIYCESARKGTSAVWAQSQGVEGTLFEIAKRLPKGDNVIYGNDVIVFGVNLLCAFITNSIYTLRFV